MSKQSDVKDRLVDLAAAVSSGRYGKGDDIDAAFLVEDAEELLDDIKTTVGYGK